MNYLSAMYNELTEAKEANFTFRIISHEDTHILNTDQISIEIDKIIYEYSDTNFSIGIKEFRMTQILASQKIANIILKPKNEIRNYFIMLLLPFVLAAITFSFSNWLADQTGFSEDFFGGVGFILFMSGYIMIFIQSSYNEKFQSSLLARAASQINPLISQLRKAKSEEDYFTRLIQVNLKNLERYYDLVRTQTDKSFLISAVGGGLGFLILIFGIVLSLIPGNEKSASTVALASGAIIEFISAIFFYLYNKTVQQLGEYHDKLVDVQNTMLALRVSQKIGNSDIKNKTMDYLTRALTNRLLETKQAATDSSSPEKPAD